MSAIKVRNLIYKGWGNTIEISNLDIKVIIVPEIGRIMHYGFLDGQNIFYENEQQKNTAEKFKNIFNKKLNEKIETNISKIKNYCKAEEYHQKYIMKRSQ